MQGGVPRAAAQLDAVRKAGIPVLYLDGGNSLFGSRELSPETVPQEERKAQALAEAMKQMQVQAHVVGTFDLARGREFEAKLGLPDQLPGTAKVLPLAGHKVALGFGLHRRAAERRRGAGPGRGRGVRPRLLRAHRGPGAGGGRGACAAWTW